MRKVKAEVLDNPPDASGVHDAARSQAQVGQVKVSVLTEHRFPGLQGWGVLWVSGSWSSATA